MKTLVATLAAGEFEALRDVLIDGEGFDLTIYKQRRNYMVCAREPFSRIIQGRTTPAMNCNLIPNWKALVVDWDGLCIFKVRASIETITNQLRERFKCEVVWQ